MQYFSLITEYGLNKQINALSNDQTIKLTKMAVGSGDGEITQSQTTLQEQKYEFFINSIEIDENNKNQLIATGVIPSDIGGFHIKEVGVFDDSGNLFAIGKIAPTYKPLLSEGSAKDLTIKFYLQVENVNKIELKIDPSVVIATRKWTLDNLNKKADKLDVYTKIQSDKKFLGINAKAKDSDLFDGLDSSEFAKVSEFEALKEPNGYVKLPNGLILQWGSTNDPKGDNKATVNAYKTMYFPISFPNACLSVNLSSTLGMVAGNQGWAGTMITSLNKSYFVFMNDWDGFDYLKYSSDFKIPFPNGFYHYIAIGF